MTDKNYEPPKNYEPDKKSDLEHWSEDDLQDLQDAARDDYIKGMQETDDDFTIDGI